MGTHNISPFLKRNKIKTFGNSMYPLLMSNDIVYFAEIKWNNIQINDIIIIKKRNILITHRVIYKTNTYLITKGDNNLKADGKVYKKDIVGKLEKVKRGNTEFHPELFYLLQSSFYLDEIKQMSILFRKYNINFLFLKGLPLHLFYEKKIPRRLYADCDILVNLADLHKIKRIFLNLGYQISKNDLNAQKKSNFGELNLYKKIQNVVVVFDIHVEPVFMMTQINLTKELYSERYMQQMSEEFLQNKKEIIVDKVSYPILQPSYLIMYVCLHFFHHNFKGSFRLSFIHTIICKEKDNKQVWSEIILTTHKYNLQSFVYPVFLLLKKYYKTQISNSIIERVKPNNYMQQKIGEHFVSDSFLNDESRLFGGINRLILLIVLSPNPIYKKVLLIFNTEVWQLFFVIMKKILLFFKQSKKRVE
ncbi:MAG TPA: signal peptidase I [Candidatus Woesebacteria bacterium]|nr:signal peptidase I [Candidatus Woesebacteria bacterium]